MVAIILFGFIGCLIAGWLIGICKDEPIGTKALAYFIALLMLGLSIGCLFGYREVYKKHILHEHYNIIEKTTTTTTYKIIPNGGI